MASRGRSALRPFLLHRGCGEQAPRTVPALFLALAMAGCSAPAEKKVLTSANAYAFYEARYSDVCVAVTGPASCDAQFAVLKTWRTRLDEAQVAIKRGGELPLQLGELKRVEKEAKKCRPR